MAAVHHGQPDDQVRATAECQCRGLHAVLVRPGHPTKSNCNGSCAAYWPPVKGSVTAGPGVTGRLATIKRSGGSAQATYDGHPLYTYIGDRAPGQAHGNALNGGLWHEVTIPG
jgi:predicted lipoprotein with Yx(FWY)xxD motif